MRNESTAPGQRPYRKRRRADQERATRERITEATVALHETVGPARTTIKAIAERAGVERATVYRHFPDDDSLFAACSAHYSARHPSPDPGLWAAVEAPDDRLRRALGDLYASYGEMESMMFNVTRDFATMPAAIQQELLGYVDAVRDVLMVGRPERGRARARIAGAIGHAISFGAWHSLTRQHGLDDEEAVAVMAASVEAAAY